MKKSLADMVNTIDWMMIEMASARTGGMNPDALKICLTGKNYSDPVVTKLMMDIGANLMQKLGWKYGDKISFFHHPDDLCAFRAVRTPEKGYKLGKFKGSIMGKIQMTWPHKQLHMKPIKLKEVEYFVHGDALLFRVDEN